MQVQHRLYIARLALIAVLMVVLWNALFTSWQPLDFMGDKLRHIMAFLGLSFFAVISFPESTTGTRLGVMAVIALGIEVAQLWAPGREFHLDDFAASFLGSCLFELIRRTVTQFLPDKT